MIVLLECSSRWLPYSWIDCFVIGAIEFIYETLMWRFCSLHSHIIFEVTLYF